MAVFAVVVSGEPAQMEYHIRSKIASNDFHKVDDQTWFVSAPGTIVTPKELSDFLGVSSGSAGRVLIMHLTAYYGFHAKETWDWLSVKGV